MEWLGKVKCHISQMCDLSIAEILSKKAGCVSECLNIFAAGCRINVKEHDGSNKMLYSTTQKSKPYSCKLAYTGLQNLRFN